MTKQTKRAQFEATSYLSATNEAYLETLYDAFLHDPSAVSPTWRQFFEGLSEQEKHVQRDVSHQPIRDALVTAAYQPRQLAGGVGAAPTLVQQEAVDAFITAYRRFGHLNATLDPLGHVAPTDARLTLARYGLSQADANKRFQTRGLFNAPYATLAEIEQRLKTIYCRTIGVEYSRIANEDERAWLREQVEHGLWETTFSATEQRTILQRLMSADGLERYLETKYPGQKRFSIEGTDTLIPMLDELAYCARQQDVQEVIIGMAHRGRLNVLLNTMGQSPKELFQEFEGTKDYGLTSGDVKYHRGFSSDRQTTAGPIHLSLAFNPSHLEFINAVVMGSVRARQQRVNGGGKRDYALGVQIHGDAAFAGQGIVMETLNMSQTRAYHIGGAIHIILNNQIGFTTSNPLDARSSHYCSDVARMIDAPVFHVNADDPEAALAVIRLALGYRMRFHKDIVIDLVGYRRHGHQEMDEPRATQPIMYQEIAKHPTVAKRYAQTVLARGTVDQASIDQWADAYRRRLDEGRQVVETLSGGLSHHYTANWTPYLNQHWRVRVDTSVPLEKLKQLAETIENIPDHFTLQRNVAMMMSARQKMTRGEQPLDWGYAETLAYASLLDQGYTVRLSGEDCRRGTFFHRHAALFDQKTGDVMMPLAQLAKSCSLEIYDSLLAEAGPLGFEYGYATAHPKALVLWEAQFGDFANGAQVIVDQFLSSAWQKWNRLSGLVMLLPHGNEGMGPEHSSARLERYLQLCAQDNMQVCVPTTPAQIFHLLRRQVLRPYRKPLIIMSPKRLLRHKMAVSTLDDLTHGQLQLLIPEIDDIQPDDVRRVIVCSGKVYYELLTQRREAGIKDIAIIRIEQLYPFPYDEYKAVLATYPNLKEIVWCQEEPKNQGAWFCTRHRLVKCLPFSCVLGYAGRHSMAAPAAGYPALYEKQQVALVSQALDLDPEHRIEV